MTFEENNKGKKIIPKMNDYKVILEMHKNRILAGNRSLSPEKRAMLLDPNQITGLSPA
jgi:hypothetical protein